MALPESDDMGPTLRSQAARLWPERMERVARVRVYFDPRSQDAGEQVLRRTTTRAEVKLWNRLRHAPFDVRFRRRYCVDTYVLDFYAPRLKLAVEITGTARIAALGKEHDQVRAAHLTSLGIRVIRFSTPEILRGIDRVMKLIGAAVMHRQGSGASRPSWQSQRRKDRER